MLSPIPRSILRDTMTLFVPTGFNRYQKPTGKTYIVRNVHVQSDNRTIKSQLNTEITLSGTIYVDARFSVPRLDFDALQEAAQAAGGQMTCTITNKAGRTSKPYTIVAIDSLPDDEDNLHHYELGVV